METTTNQSSIETVAHSIAELATTLDRPFLAIDALTTLVAEITDNDISRFTAGVHSRRNNPRWVNVLYTRTETGPYDHYEYAVELNVTAASASVRDQRSGSGWSDPAPRGDSLTFEQAAQVFVDGINGVYENTARHETVIN